MSDKDSVETTRDGFDKKSNQDIVRTTSEDVEVDRNVLPIRTCKGLLNKVLI